MTRRRQQGVTLVMVLVMTLALLAIGLSAAELAWQGEKAARAQRDRYVAFQAAEAALDDAEKDIAGSVAPASAADAATLRQAQFDPSAATGFAASCSAAPSADAYRGLLQRAPSGAKPVWQVLDLSGAADGGACSVPLGTFTGAVIETGQGFLPFKRPRYIVERMECHQPGDDAGAGSAPHYCYRVTAIGFGAQPTTEVVLQTVYRRPE